jgi:6,7-dimethyl-8-ribityllumazine synthase
MPTTIEGTLSAAGLRFAIVASRFNGLIVESLIAGAIDAIVRSGGSDDAITVVRCPGAWELPQVVRRVLELHAPPVRDAARSGKAGPFERGGVDAVIALGAVIRGATPHFDYVAGEAASGIARAAAESPIPVSFGVLTTDTIEQALERAGTKAGNKGFDAALAAIELATLYRTLAAKKKR